MKRLLYIIVICILGSVAIVAQTAVETSQTVRQVSDSIGTDSVYTASTTDSLTDAEPSDSNVHVSATQRPGYRKRFVNPVNNAATRTQNNNDAQGDSLRMLERRRQRSIHYHDENGNTIMVDTVTGQEWVDSTLLPAPPKMKQPLLFRVEAGVNIWDPVMRIFGQKYGGIDFSVALNLHNRYIPTLEAGFGTARKTPATMNFTYHTPVAPYFKLGADYNFVYNSNPDYRFVAGLRYGFSAFSYRLTDVSYNSGYWGEAGNIVFPTQNLTAGWVEIVLGLRVKIAGPVSAGWMFRYHTVLHQSHPTTGDAWYIPGYGTQNSSITGSFSIVYNFGLKPPHTEDTENSAQTSRHH